MKINLHFKFLRNRSDSKPYKCIQIEKKIENDEKIIRKTKCYKLASEIINQVQLAGLILCLVYLKANTYILC